MKAYLFAAAVMAVTTASAVAQDVIIAPERETVIREYVKKKPLASISIPGVELNIGSRIPETVQVQSLDVPDAKYDYVVVDNRTVIVDPVSREIIAVYD